MKATTRVTRPYVSGWCNPTNPAPTMEYDPHTRCDGCSCSCHLVDPHRTDEPRLAREEPPDTASIGDAVAVVGAAADLLNRSAMSAAITPLTSTEGLHLLDSLRDSIETLRKIDAALTQHIYLRSEHGPVEVDGIGVVHVYRSRDGVKWDERGAVQAVLDARMEETGGEVPSDPWVIAEWLLEAGSFGYFRKTALRSIGIDPSGLLESTPGRAKVDLPKRH